MNNTTKNIIKVSAILLAVGGAVIITRRVIKRYNERKDAERKKELEIENQGGVNQNQIEIEQEQSTYNPSNDIKTISDKIIGANIIYYPKEIADIMMSKNDGDLKILANAWKKKYGRTLWKDLDDEWDSCGAWYYPFENCYKAPMDRLRRLGLN